MPMFEYKCKDCGYCMDVLVKSSKTKPGNVVCEKCSSKNTERVISGFAVGQSKAGMCSGSSCCSTGTCCPDGACSL